MKFPCKKCICLPACQHSKTITPLVTKCSLIASYVVNYKKALDAIHFFKPGYYVFLCNNSRHSLMKDNIMKILEEAKRIRGGE